MKVVKKKSLKWKIINFLWYLKSKIDPVPFF
jgi:hypothetical protein